MLVIRDSFFCPAWVQAIETDMNDRARAIKHWVVFRLGHLGDVVLSTGVLNYLANEHGWSFTYVTKADWAKVFSESPFVKTVVQVDGETLKPGAFFSFCRSLADEYKNWGLLDLHGNMRSLILARFWRGPVFRYPKMALQRRLFLHTQRCFWGPLYQKLLRATSVPQRYAMAVADLPPPAQSLLPYIRLSEKERNSARSCLDSLFTPGSVPVALHPYATNILKIWPEEHWRRLVAHLDAAGLAWIALGVGQSLFPHRRNDLSNSTKLRESIALLSLCRVLVTGDSGPMHLASAVQTPVIALFGPTTREWGFYPAGRQDRVFESDLPCRPCSLHGKRACSRQGECLSSIAPERIFQAIEDMYISG